MVGRTFWDQATLACENCVTTSTFDAWLWHLTVVDVRASYRNWNLSLKMCPELETAEQIYLETTPTDLLERTVQDHGRSQQSQCGLQQAGALRCQSKRSWSHQSQEKLGTSISRNSEEIDGYCFDCRSPRAPLRLTY